VELDNSSIETDPGRLAESLGLKRSSPEVIVIPAHLGRVALTPLIFAWLTFFGIWLVLHPRARGYLGMPPDVFGWLVLVVTVPELVPSLLNLLRGGPRLTLTPAGFTVRRPIYDRTYRWKDVGRFAVEEKRYLYKRVPMVTFDHRGPDRRSWFRRLVVSRQNVLRSPVGAQYPYSMAPEKLVKLLNAYSARYGAIRTS
jgi:hypothetical protein